MFDLRVIKALVPGVALQPHLTELVLKTCSVPTEV